jgi:galactan 5-O-arabinofuranosyltransferase
MSSSTTHPPRRRQSPRGYVGRVAPLTLVGLTALTVLGTAARALHGTRWGFNALYSDAAFRTEAATRFAASAWPSDYAYRGLPAYYPPALPWIEGRVATVTGVEAWTVLKPVSLVFAVVVPLLAYAAWRRVVPSGTAAVVVAVTTLTTVDLIKPDEWLVLAVLLPWWLEVVRGIRRPDVRSLRAWVHGLVLGLLVLFHTFYLLPLAAATVLATALDLLTRRGMVLRPGRAAAVGAVALVCATPYWVPLAVARLQGAVADQEQRRWSTVGFTVPQLPFPVTSPTAGVGGLVGLLGLVAVVWVAVRWRSVPLAGALGTALVAAYGVMVGGQVAQRWGVALLVEKTDRLIVALLVSAGIIGAGDLLQLLGRRLRRRVAVPLGLLGTVAVCLLAGSAFEACWGHGVPVQAAQHTRYPDGTFPTGDGVTEPISVRHPWGVPASADAPSTHQVEAAWRDLTGHPLGAGDVLVTTRVDLVATVPVHPFLTWKNIYSHPYGHYRGRLALLRRLQRCGSSRCAAQLLRHNPYDTVDGLVLTRSGGRLGVEVTTDNFPNGSTLTPVELRPSLFRGPSFRRRDVGDVAVIQVLPALGAR